MRKKFYVLLIFLLVLLATACNNNKSPKFQESSEENWEIAYQNGIELIQQGEWDKVATKLVFLQKRSYKNSKILYNYAQAKKYFQNQNFSQAGSYMKEIPDTYDGEFKDDILAFKKVCAEKANSLTTEQIQEENKRFSEMIDKEIKKADAQNTKTPPLGTSGNTPPSNNAPYLYSGNGNVVVAVSESVMDEAVDAAISKDYQKFDNLVLSGKLLTVKDGTKIDIINVGLTRTKVRILEGDFSGQIGYIQTEFVKVK